MEDPELKQKWFDRWLKGVDNGVEDTPTVNLYPIGGTQLGAPRDVAGAGRKYTPIYLGGERSLRVAKAPRAGRRRRARRCCPSRARARG